MKRFFVWGINWKPNTIYSNRWIESRSKKSNLGYARGEKTNTKKNWKQLIWEEITALAKEIADYLTYVAYPEDECYTRSLYHIKQFRNNSELLLQLKNEIKKHLA